ncbi:MAG TPA: lipoprotein [Burkholderiaceae bacterium]|jgi:predicted small lipoprotein YifL|nr:lipoprotein [Burkholderiaceae bacterium]
MICSREILRIQRLSVPVVATTVLGLSLLVGCGQKGALYLPTESAAADRATLPQAIMPISSQPATTSPTR